MRTIVERIAYRARFNPGWQSVLQWTKQCICAVHSRKQQQGMLAHTFTLSFSSSTDARHVSNSSDSFQSSYVQSTASSFPNAPTSQVPISELRLFSADSTSQSPMPD